MLLYMEGSSGPEVSFAATLPAQGVAAVTGLLNARFNAPGTSMRLWQRTYRSTLSANQRGISEITLLSDGESALLRTENADRLTISHLAKVRPAMVLQARRVTRAHVGAGAPHFVAAQGFEMAYEHLRRGMLFEQGATTIALFQLCRRLDHSPQVGGDDAWEPLGDGLWLLEASFRGQEMRTLLNEADAWADALESLATLQPVK